MNLGLVYLQCGAAVFGWSTAMVLRAVAKDTRPEGAIEWGLSIFLAAILGLFCAAVWPLYIASKIWTIAEGVKNGRHRKTAEAGTDCPPITFHPPAAGAAIGACAGEETRTGRHLMFEQDDGCVVLACIPQDWPEKLPRSTEFGEKIAWRYWRVIATEGLLQSVIMDTIWEPGMPMRGNIYHELVAGDGGGVHSFTTREEALREATQHRFVTYINEALGVRPRLHFAIGRVKIWGDCVIHERGYRSEFASVLSLEDGLDLPEEVLARLRAKYCPPGTP